MCPGTDDTAKIAVEYPLGDPRDDNAMAPSHAYRGTIILLHGYDLFDNQPGTDPWAALHSFVRMMREHFEPMGYLVINPAYRTDQPFPFGAQQVMNGLRYHQIPLQHVHVFGYSMGGLVARQMIANGDLSPVSLTTYCSPHMGTGWWIPSLPFKNGGARSLEPASPEIMALYNNARDQEMRQRYHCLGVGYYELGNSKWHDNDQLIECKSQLMWSFDPPPGAQHKWAFHRQVPVSPQGGVHSNCQQEPMVRAAFAHMTHLINQLDGPF